MADEVKVDSLWSALYKALIVGINTVSYILSEKERMRKKNEADKAAEEFIRAKEKAKIDQSIEERQAAEKKVAELGVVVQEGKAALDKIEQDRNAKKEKIAKILSWDDVFQKKESVQ